MGAPTPLGADEAPAVKPAVASSGPSWEELKAGLFTIKSAGQEGSQIAKIT